MENKTCATCTENDGGLCDLKGWLLLLLQQEVQKKRRNL